MCCRAEGCEIGVLYEVFQDYPGGGGWGFARSMGVENWDDAFVPSGVGGHRAYGLGDVGLGDGVVEVVELLPCILVYTPDECEVTIHILDGFTQTLE